MRNNSKVRQSLIAFKSELFQAFESGFSGTHTHTHVKSEVEISVESFELMKASQPTSIFTRRCGSSHNSNARGKSKFPRSTNKAEKRTERQYHFLSIINPQFCAHATYTQSGLCKHNFMWRPESFSLAILHERMTWIIDSVIHYRVLLAFVSKLDRFQHFHRALIV